MIMLSNYQLFNCEVLKQTGGNASSLLIHKKNSSIFFTSYVLFFLDGALPLESAARKPLGIPGLPLNEG